MSSETRILLINIRSLLLKAVDLIERACELGKYAKPAVEEMSSDANQLPSV
jgi:hypothetical protein